MLKSQYYAVCAETDAQLGRLFDFLRERGEWERTVVVFTADHAEQLGDHWLTSKLGFFDQSYHLPLIIRDPRPTADAGRGRVVEAYTEAVDVMPSLMEIVGLAVPPQVDGRALTPFLEGAPTPSRWRDTV